MREAFIIPKLDTDDGRFLVENLLEAAADAALLVDRELCVLYMTEGFVALTGQRLEDYKSHSVRELKIGQIELLEEVLSSGKRKMATTMQIGGQYLMVNLLPVVWEGRVTGVVMMIPFRSMAILKRAIGEQERRFSTEISLPGEKGHTFADFVGDSPSILTLIEQCHRIAHSTHPVLLMGETGVGKEILSGGIYHEYCGGRKLPFIKINCSAIPRDLLESELFGHEKGAFTGANAMKRGKFELAEDGVILLDEIGEMDLSLQSKLLRVLEEREFERIGGSKTIPLRAKIIASTNENLIQMAAKKKFRMDLYYRLSVFEISVPPLRSHKGDIPKLMEHFKRVDKLELEFTQDALNMMFHYNWPGNVRELRNILNRLHFLYPNTVIDQMHIYNATGEMFHLVELEDYRGGEDPMPPPTQARVRYDREGNLVSETPPPSPGNQKTLEEMETQHILSVLEGSGSHAEAARVLGISRSTLYAKMKKYGISSP